VIRLLVVLVADTAICFVGSVVALDLIIERVGVVWQGLSILYLSVIVAVPLGAILRGRRAQDKILVATRAALVLLAVNLVALPFILGSMAM
jgi:hypothetical protein